MTAAALAALFSASCNNGSIFFSPTTTTVNVPPGGNCVVHPDGSQSCVVEGRPLWRRGRRWRRGRGLLLPVGPHSMEAKAEYASVASFGELALRLLAVGAPASLVADCHRAALEEIGHAHSVSPAGGFGPIPGLLGRRIAGRRRSRRGELRRIAVESLVDGWRNEGMAAARLRARGLHQMADEEQGHAELARRIVEWCFEQDPAGVGRALAKAA